MSRRSVTNDRYRVEQKGKTRKSASAAKPKRAAGEAPSPSASRKASAKPKSALGRLFSGGGSGVAAARIEPTPRMKVLRRAWWAFMGAAILLALVMLQTSKMGNPILDRVVLGSYLVALGGALYIEFGPLRRARVEAAAAAKSGKGAKKVAKVGDKPAKPAAEAAQPAAAAVTSVGRTGLLDRVAGLFGRKKAGGDQDDGTA